MASDLCDALFAEACECYAALDALLSRRPRLQAMRCGRTTLGKRRASLQALILNARSRDRACLARLPNVADKQRGITYERMSYMARQLPGVEETMAYGAPVLRVGGLVFARLRSEAEGALMLDCDIEDRKRLLASDPGAFFVTADYRHHPLVLVRLERVRPANLWNLILRAWRRSTAESRRGVRRRTKTRERERPMECAGNDRSGAPAPHALSRWGAAERKA